MPHRVQMRRTKGWRMPENTVYVGRPSLWGNPWDLGSASHVPSRDRAAWVVRRYRLELNHLGMLSDWSAQVSERRWDEINEIIRSGGATNMAEAAPILLRGKNLACWCPLDQPCHADVLLELANPEEA